MNVKLPSQRNENPKSTMILSFYCVFYQHLNTSYTHCFIYTFTHILLLIIITSNHSYMHCSLYSTPIFTAYFTLYLLRTFVSF
jgi:hypothetical protein